MTARILFSQEISRWISRDVGLAGGVLKLANSPNLRLPKPICSIAEAIACLGLDLIRSWLLGLRKDGRKRLDEDRCDGQGIAMIERSLAISELAPLPAHLLHQTGKFLLVSSLPERYNAAVRFALKEQIEVTESEQRCFGLSHVELGSALLGLWGLPAVMWQSEAVQRCSPTCDVDFWEIESWVGNDSLSRGGSSVVAH